MRGTNLKKIKTVASKLKKASAAHAKQSATLSKVVKNVSKKRK